jgi:hypothetical protein
MHHPKRKTRSKLAAAGRHPTPRKVPQLRSEKRHRQILRALWQKRPPLTDPAVAAAGKGRNKSAIYAGSKNPRRLIMPAILIIFAA